MTLIKPAILRIVVDYRSMTNGQVDVAIALDKSALKAIGERIADFPGPVRTFGK